VRNLIIGSLSLCIVCSLSSAAVVTVPAGLQAGDTYQLIFVSADGFNATSSSISDYNTDVSNEAALDPALAAFDIANGVTWTAIASTASIAANVNAPSTGNVYTLDGTQVASNGMYSDALLFTPTVDQYGNTDDRTFVWTGNYLAGAQDPGAELGTADPILGYSNYTTHPWEFYSDATTLAYTPGSLLPLYGISSVITVAPEPGTFALLSAALLLISYRVHRKRRRA
jgi:hypothetical protein